MGTDIWRRFGRSTLYASVPDYPTLSDVRRDDSDIVTVTGAVKSGTATAGTVMFTLPIGYRPAATYRTVTSSVGSVARIQVNRNGTVATVSGVASGDCHLSLSFAARPGT